MEQLGVFIHKPAGSTPPGHNSHYTFILNIDKLKDTLEK